MPRTASPSPCASACSPSWSLSSSSSSSSSFVPSLPSSPSSAEETSGEGEARTTTTRELRVPETCNSPVTSPRPLDPEYSNSRVTRPRLVVPEYSNSPTTSAKLPAPANSTSPVASPTPVIPKHPDSPRINTINTTLHVPPYRDSRGPSPGRSSASKTPPPRTAKHKTIWFMRQRKQQRDRAPKEIPRISPKTSPSTAPSTSPRKSPKTPLWHSVKQIMDNEAFLRNKCTVLKINLSHARTAHDKLKRQVGECQTALADQDARLANLQEELHLERQTSQRATEAFAAREQECQALRTQVHHQAYEVRVYKTALKAAFKLPGLAAQTTYRSILMVTDRQLRKSLGERLAAADEQPETLAPSSTSATSAAPDGGHAARDSRPGSPADHVLPTKRGPFSLQAEAEVKTDARPVVAANEAGGHGQTQRPQDAAGGSTDPKPDPPRTPKTNAKRGTDSDSDGAPASKTRKLTPRGRARKILHD
ncbi:hypothetical protein E4U54_004049 [Claviceps lovelessii]|nr:hypothetical protein E4U54_004049 [Claviceps lovelessii]